MKILIDIPEEFGIDYITNKFEEFFGRVIADMDTLCGTYEKETANMFIKAFEDSKPYAPDRVMEQLGELAEEYHRKAVVFAGHDDQECGRAASAAAAYEQAIEIVKAAGINDPEQQEK
nr:MAG TPA: hypothetical protein [Caudoviricetes sp.]